MKEVIVVKGVVAKRLKEEVEKLDISLEEYLLDLMTREMDPRDRAREYIEASEKLLTEAKEELEKNNIRQAAEKVWGAAALTIKAYAFWKNGKRLVSHSELWEYKRKLEREMGSWVGDAWARAVEMHVCFYEKWCNKIDIENSLKAVEKLVREVKQKFK